MDKICEVRNSISDMKVKKDEHSEQGKENKQFGMNLKTKIQSSN